jgi:hypothetical protein
MEINPADSAAAV